MYTQNIDTLENKAGVPSEKIIYCHGSVGKAHCLRCGKESDLAEFEPIIRAGNVPRCADCLKREAEGKAPVIAPSISIGVGANVTTGVPAELNPPILKPNVTFFGEDLDPQFFVDKMNDFPKCDLLIVSGTSLKIGPVNTLIFETAKDVPQILVDRQMVGPPNHFDFYLMGNSDDVFGCLAQKLGWEGVAAPGAQFNIVYEAPNITHVQYNSASASSSSSSSTSTGK